MGELVKILLQSFNGWLFVPLSIASYYGFQVQNPNPLHFTLVGGNLFLNMVVFGMNLAGPQSIAALSPESLSQHLTNILIYRTAIFSAGTLGGGWMIYLLKR